MKKFLCLRVRGSQNRSYSVYPDKIFIGDSSIAWRSAGFNVVDRDGIGIVNFDEMKIILNGGESQGVIGWSFKNLVKPLESVCSVPIVSNLFSFPEDKKDIVHNNGVISIDHIVLKTSDPNKVNIELESIGILRKRQIIDPIRKLEQNFYRPSKTIIEVVTHLNNSHGNANDVQNFIWGITFTSKNIDHTHSVLPNSTKKPHPAVQAHRFITVLNSEKHSISTKIAFISPHVSSHKLY
jgi:hypothetical protein